MVSIFRSIKENKIDVIRHLIGLATGDNAYHSSLTKEEHRYLQHLLKLSGTKYYDLNKKSVYGRTPLHCAVTWNRLQIAEMLLDCPLVDVNVQDRENGWTALHRALYMGHIEMAMLLLKREDINLTIKDHEGLEPFELYEITIMSESYPRLRAISSQQSSIPGEEDAMEGKDRMGGTDLYTWGHNTNYVLGHADSENRIRPERLKLQSEVEKHIIHKPELVIESITMSKFHMAILTSDPAYNLLVCGFGRGGRLGTGKDIETQFTPAPIHWSERIQHVALGRDHTIAVTESGNVLSFGSNRYGQLGYGIDGTQGTEENAMQFTPRKIQAQSLKKQPIIGVAASRVHSVAYTSEAVFTFGLNQGQLGYHQSDNESCQNIPRKVAISHGIIQVVANDNGTAILTTNHEIILLCNYTQQKIFLPINYFPGNIQVHRLAINYPVKLLGSGTAYLGAVTNMGDVYVWSCRSPGIHQDMDHSEMGGTRKTSKGLAVTTVISSPKRIWAHRRGHLAAVDASIGQDGLVIVCTVSGHVFVGHKESNGYKFNVVPSLQRCVRVCANSSGAFAAIRSEYLSRPVSILPSTLTVDIASSLPYYNVSAALKVEIQRLKESKYNAIREMSDRFKLAHDMGEDVVMYKEQEDVLDRKYSDLINKSVDDAWKQIESISINDPSLDTVIVVGDRRIYCHSVLLQCRTNLFKQLVKRVDKIQHRDIDIKVSKREDNLIQLEFGHCEMASMLLLIDYIYTDQYQHPMSSDFKMSPLCYSGETPDSKHMQHIQKDLLSLATLFDLPHLLNSAESSFNHRPVPSFTSHLKELLHNKRNATIELHTKDNTVLFGHEIILRQRCSFFRFLLDPQSVWMVTRRLKSEGLLPVDVSYTSRPVMEILLRYMYLDEDETSLFDTIAVETEDELVGFLIEVLNESDAFLLNRLKSIGERALLRFLRLRNVLMLYEQSDKCLAESLKYACLQFIGANLPLFLDSSHFRSLPKPLIHDIEHYIRHCQSNEVACINYQDMTHLFSVEEEDTELAFSIHQYIRDDLTAYNQYEHFVTLYPSKGKSKMTTTNSVEENKSSTKLASVNKSKNRPSVVENVTDSFESPRKDTAGGWVSPDMHTKPSLREIIESEHIASQHHLKNTKPSTIKKKSQKERKKLLHHKETSNDSTSPKPVWGKVNVEVTPIRKSLNENMIASSSDDRKGKKIYIAEEDLLIPEVPMEKVVEAPFNPVDCFGSSFEMTLPTRYTSTSGSKMKSSFQTIQKQQEKEDSWLKSKPKKNLLAIQKEDQAIDSIKQQYINNIDIMSGEWIEIYRLKS
ncbi:hypothetical protein BDB01DRAFT_612890 [Pilobolus umbonatus]|nr:hypothetical protein BDB01DRAFT_612890 [Pilobolus umbonatus]